MKTHLIGAALAALLTAGPGWTDTTGATETYDLLFRHGTLDGLPRDESLVYARTVTNSYTPDAEERDTGQIELAFAGGEPERAVLNFQQGEKHRNLGAFPASVGNPIIMYFVETVVRDMAESAGGSPFYIRNRVKEALVSPAELSGGPVAYDGGEVSATALTMKPFADDPNAERMDGFGDLEIIVTMSEAVPGWYYSLEAVVPGTGDTPRYASVLSLLPDGKVR